MNAEPEGPGPTTTTGVPAPVGPADDPAGGQDAGRVAGQDASRVAGQDASRVAGQDDGDGASGGRGVDTGGWRRLSRRMLIIHPFQEVVRSFPALIGLLFAGSARGGQGHIWTLVGLGVMIVLGTLRWFTTTYRVTPQYVQVRKGLVRRKVLTAPRDRIRTVDVTSHVMHRILGLARVEIGTGRSDRKDGGTLKLDALHATEVDRLRDELLHRRPAASAATSAAGSRTGVPLPAGAQTGLPTPAGASTGLTTPADPAGGVAPGGVAAHAPVGSAAYGHAGVAEAPETVLAALRPQWIRYGPFTLSGLVTVGVLAGFVSRIVSEGNVDLLSAGPVRQVVDWFGREALILQIAASLLVLAVFVAVASTIGYILAFWAFRLTRTPGGTLHVTRGLITTRATTLEERRLRGIELSEPLLLRAVGGARCIAVATGLRVGRGAQRGGSMLLPPAPRAEALNVAARVIGTSGPLTAELVPHGPAALRRRFTRALTTGAIFTGVLLVLSYWLGLPAWTWQTTLVATVVAMPVAADRYRSLGHTIEGDHLVTRWGSLVRRRVALHRDGIIGWNVRRSFFQRRAGLATLTATTAAGGQGYSVWDVDLSEALRTADRGIPGLLTPFLVRDGEA
ncbi:PH domain-containing protein [Sphaerisporangium corydalis]|uniref:PH domain-containing protein n=1 Tax=Sphaerisporangium corydalis TaxID=1441875 RepID=A0ABV9EKW5_9ACTN|nr:PH domain-containing protein [Sphaerisporangium corydalis]